MRADRLVAALLILQSRGRVTAAELAEELEISERTARRDLEALGMAGIPVYSQPGRGGGWSLIGGARTDLSGLTADEARTLFLVAGPSSSATPEVKAALRKLVRALPETFRAEAEAAASAVVLDPTTWDRSPREPPPHLDALQRAVVERKQVRIAYTGRDRRETERAVHPLGLVRKGIVWYLVAGTDAGQRTFRVDRVRSVTLTDEPSARPDGFDLAAEWDTILASLDEQRVALRATVRVDREMIGLLRSMFGTRLTELDTHHRADGDRVVFEVRGHSVETLGGELAGLADHLEVIDPPEVRTQLARLGAALTRQYG
jgi:predicted DNA-binding transcriptional regulator YafY